MENVNCKGLEFHIICIPSWQDVEKAVNQLLWDKPDLKVVESKTYTVPFYRKNATTKCPKCDASIMPNRALNTGGACLKCGRNYTNEEFNLITEVNNQIAGSFFVVELWLSEKTSKS